MACRHPNVVTRFYLREDAYAEPINSCEDCGAALPLGPIELNLANTLTDRYLRDGSTSWAAG